MMDTIIWIAAPLFSSIWTIGLITQPDMRMKNTIVTVVYWWIEIFLAYQSSYDVVHLLWLMPLSMAVPFLFILTRSVLIIFIQSAVILAPALYFLIS